MNFNQKTHPGRPKKKPEYCKESNIQELIQTAVMLFGEPYDDRVERSPNAPTLTSVAKIMNTTPMRVRKLLITARYYSTEVSRKVQMLREEGYSIKPIMEETGLKSAAVYGNLPLSRGSYMLEYPTLYSEQCRLYRKRKNACAAYQEHVGGLDEEAYLWSALETFQDYPFRLNDSIFKYQISDEQFCFNNKDQLTRDEIMLAYQRIRSGSILEPTTLIDERLYLIFLRIGACQHNKL